MMKIIANSEFHTFYFFTYPKIYSTKTSTAKSIENLQSTCYYLKVHNAHFKLLSHEISLLIDQVLPLSIKIYKKLATSLVEHPAGTSVISALFEGFYNGGL